MQHAVDELIRLMDTFPRENMDVSVDAEDVSMFQQHHSKLMFKVTGRSSALSHMRNPPAEGPDKRTERPKPLQQLLLDPRMTV